MLMELPSSPVSVTLPLQWMAATALIETEGGAASSMITELTMSWDPAVTLMVISPPVSFARAYRLGTDHALLLRP